MEFAFNRPFGLMTPTRTILNGRSFFLRILYIMLAGMVGTLARYGMDGWISGRAGTLAVNLTGSFALGFIVRYATGSMVVAPDVRAALTIGFCGAFTTMSTFSYESMALLSDGDYWRASTYISGTLAGCLVAVALGTALANKLL